MRCECRDEVRGGETSTMELRVDYWQGGWILVSGFGITSLAGVILVLLYVGLRRSRATVVAVGWPCHLTWASVSFGF